MYITKQHPSEADCAIKVENGKCDLCHTKDNFITPESIHMYYISERKMMITRRRRRSGSTTEVSITKSLLRI